MIPLLAGRCQRVAPRNLPRIEAGRSARGANSSAPGPTGHRHGSPGRRVCPVARRGVWGAGRCKNALLKASAAARRSLTAFGMTKERWGDGCIRRRTVSEEPVGADTASSRQDPGVRRSLTAFGMTKARRGSSRLRPPHIPAAATSAPAAPPPPLGTPCGAEIPHCVGDDRGRPGARRWAPPRRCRGIGRRAAEQPPGFDVREMGSV